MPHLGRWSRRATSVASLLFALLLFAGAAGAGKIVYDTSGRLTGVFDQAGAFTQYVYDDAGNLIRAVNLAKGSLAIMALNSSRGIAGSTVRIDGAGFGFAPSELEVRFNNTLATVSAAAGESLTVTVPASATTGKVSVTLGATTVTSSDTFYVVPSNQAPPTITDVFPTKRRYCL